MGVKTSRSQQDGAAELTSATNNAKRREIGCIGLDNLGNTCFMNAALQCLSHTAPLKDFFLDPDSNWKNQLNRDNFLGHHGEVADAFGSLMQAMWCIPESYNDALHGVSNQLMQEEYQAQLQSRCSLSCCRGAIGTGSVTTTPNSTTTNNVIESSVKGISTMNTQPLSPPPSPARPSYSYPTSLSPQLFKSAIGKHNEIFQGYQQHDTQELLIFLLDALHEDLNRVLKKPYVEDLEYDGVCMSKESDAKLCTDTDTVNSVAAPKAPRLMCEEACAKLAWIGHLQRDQSVIVDLFQGQLRSELTCMHCGNKSIKFEPFANLELPLQSSNDCDTDSNCNKNSNNKGPKKYVATDINQVLRDYSKQEVLTGDHQWRCPKCKELRDATKQLTLFNLPNILILTFKRFEVDMYGQPCGKIGVHVDFPLVGLDVSAAMSTTERNASAASGDCVDGDADTDNDPHYDLYGVANHLGTIGGGHYISYAKNTVDQSWYKFDDSR